MLPLRSSKIGLLSLTGRGSRLRMITRKHCIRISCLVGALLTAVFLNATVTSLRLQPIFPLPGVSAMARGGSWFTRHGLDYAGLGPSDGCRLTRRPSNSSRVDSLAAALCGKRDLRILKWTPGPGFGGESLWRKGDPRKVEVADRRLCDWIEAVKKYLGIDTTAYPVGTAPDNEHFFPQQHANASSVWASASNSCGLSGVSMLENNFLLPDADVVIVDYPYLSAGMYPQREAGVAMILFFSGESAHSYPDVVAGDFNARFDLTVGLPRGFFDFPGIGPYAVPAQLLSNAVSSQLSAMQAEGGWSIHRSAVAMAVGHCELGTVRGDYFRDLMGFIRVDSYGKCLSTATISPSQVAAAADAPTLPCFGCNWPYRKEKLEIFKAYPFVLTFENSNCYDYVTEKIYDAFLSGAVPVYLGAPNIEEWVPRGSFIDARQFSGPEELASYLTALAADPVRYAQYHAWRSQDLYGDAFRLMRTTMDELVSLSHCGFLQFFLKRYEECGAKTGAL